MFDYLIVGAGFAGSILAERSSAIEAKKVFVAQSLSLFKKIKTESDQQPVHVSVLKEISQAND